MSKLTTQQKELLKSYKYYKKMLENSNPDASYDRHDTILNQFEYAKLALEATGYKIDERSFLEKVIDKLMRAK